MEIAVVVWCLFGMGAAIVATNKRRSGCGWFIIGFLLGPIGFIFALFASDRRDQQLAPQQAVVTDEEPDELPGKPILWVGVAFAALILFFVLNLASKAFR